MLDALTSLTNHLNAEYGINYLGGHKEFHATLNPGKTESGENRYCPGNIGSGVVDYLRNKTGIKPPHLMTAPEKSAAGFPKQYDYY